MKIYIGVYQHKHGTDVEAYATAELAEKARQEIAAQWWEHELDEESMPDDPAKAADIYFEHCDEYYIIEERELIK